MRRRRRGHGSRRGWLSHSHCLLQGAALASAPAEPGLGGLGRGVVRGLVVLVGGIPRGGRRRRGRRRRRGLLRRPLQRRQRAEVGARLLHERERAKVRTRRPVPAHLHHRRERVEVYRVGRRRARRRRPLVPRAAPHVAGDPHGDGSWRRRLHGAETVAAPASSVGASAPKEEARVERHREHDEARGERDRDGVGETGRGPPASLGRRRRRGPRRRWRRRWHDRVIEPRRRRGIDGEKRLVERTPVDTNAVFLRRRRRRR